MALRGGYRPRPLCRYHPGHRHRLGVPVWRDGPSGWAGGAPRRAGRPAPDRRSAARRRGFHPGSRASLPAPQRCHPRRRGPIGQLGPGRGRSRRRRAAVGLRGPGTGAIALARGVRGQGAGDRRLHDRVLGSHRTGSGQWDRGRWDRGRWDRGHDGGGGPATEGNGGRPSRDGRPPGCRGHAAASLVP